jgi:hypothetical protein
MLHLIETVEDNFFKFLSDDPVRPHIPFVARIGNNKDIFVSKDGDTVNAITCVSYQAYVPESELELFDITESPSIAVFYTIWSYKSGAGRDLILDAVNFIQTYKPHIRRFVTLSPKTEMARKFHLKNGAKILWENQDTINYEYIR